MTRIDPGLAVLPVVMVILAACAVLRDPPGPGVPDWSAAEQVTEPTENQNPFAIVIGVCIGEPIDGSPDEAGVWHYRATAAPCDAGR